MSFLSSAVGVSFDSCANNYCGKSAGSEPEAQAVMDFVGNHFYLKLFINIVWV